MARLSSLRNPKISGVLVAHGFGPKEEARSLIAELREMVEGDGNALFASTTDTSTPRTQNPASRVS